MARKLLVVSVEPPPTSSGLGTLWFKLAEHINDESFRIDFLGPHPSVASPYKYVVKDYNFSSYGIGPPPMDRIVSVGRNRNTGIKRFFWSFLGVPFYFYRRMNSGKDIYLDWIIKRINDFLEMQVKDNKYDAIGVHVPPFPLASPVCEIARKLKLPFVFIVGDPIGYRAENSIFHPQHFNAQQQLFRDASSIAMTKETYSFCYEKLFSIDKSKLFFFSDSFIKYPKAQNKTKEQIIGCSTDVIMHWGQIDSWRPIQGFVEGLRRLNTENISDDYHFNFWVMGKIMDRKSRRDAKKKLGSSLRTIRQEDYLTARDFAAASDYLLVIVSPRHLDNIPSKLIDSLAYKRPILLLADQRSAAADFVNQYGIGLTCHPMNIDSIIFSLKRLKEEKNFFVKNYEADKIESDWDGVNVGRRFKEDFFATLNW